MAVVAGFGLIVLFEAQFGGEVFPSRILFGYIETPKWDFPGGEVVFNAFAAGGAVATALAVRWLWAVGDAAGRRETVFLVVWLALEALAYHPLTPFPAARRVLGPLVAPTVLIGRRAARAWPTARARRVAWVWGGRGVVLGLEFFAPDWREACAEEWGAEQAAARRGGGCAWHFG